MNVPFSRTEAPSLSLWSLLVGALLCSSWPKTACAGERVTVEAYGAYERCMEIPAGISALYSFRAADSIDFDIHYHADGKTQYPRLQRDITEGTGSYRSRSTREYCLSWSNPREGNVEVTIEVSTARR